MNVKYVLLVGAILTTGLWLVIDLVNEMDRRGTAATTTFFVTNVSKDKLTLRDNALSMAMINMVHEEVSAISPDAFKVTYLGFMKTSGDATHLSGFFIISDEGGSVIAVITHPDIQLPLGPTMDREEVRKTLEGRVIAFTAHQGHKVISEAIKEPLASWERQGYLTKLVTDTLMWELGRSHLPVKETDQGRLAKSQEKLMWVRQ